MAFYRGTDPEALGTDEVNRFLTDLAVQKSVAASTQNQALNAIVFLFRLEDGYDIRTVQDLLGHKDVSTTMIYTHVMNRPGLAVKSPLAPHGEPCQTPP